MLISEKITLYVVLLVFFVLVIVGNENLELFLILILIGVLIIREFTDMLAPIKLKNRFNIFISIFLIFFIIIIGRSVLTIL